MTLAMPHLGDYSVPLEGLLRMLFPHDKVLIPPPNSKRSIELGARHSPDTVCVPFKYNLGNMIEALEHGADVLAVIGGGCRYGYYGELQEQILKDLGYNFTFFSLTDPNGLKMKNAHKALVKLGCKASFARFLYAAALTVRKFMVMDKLDAYIRANVGFQTVPNSFENLKKQFLAELRQAFSFRAVGKVRRKYNRLLKRVPVNVPPDCLRVGLIGELFMVIDSFANYYMEKELAKLNVRITRYTDVTYLLFTSKKRKEARNLRDAGGRLKYHLGADGTHSVATCHLLAKRGYDGVIHLKPFGCMPEINAMPALMNIGRDLKMPVLFFSFDAHTSETGVKTRLEAFYDMLKMKKEKS